MKTKNETSIRVGRLTRFARWRTILRWFKLDYNVLKELLEVSFWR